VEPRTRPGQTKLLLFLLPAEPLPSWSHPTLKDPFLLCHLLLYQVLGEVCICPCSISGRYQGVSWRSISGAAIGVRPGGLGWVVVTLSKLTYMGAAGASTLVLGWESRAECQTSSLPSLGQRKPIF
jgi:hypothetical protein